MNPSELQMEEREVLESIYYGDECFKQIANNIFQYKYGESDSCKSFLLEIHWGSTYPDTVPAVNLDAFYNKHLSSDLKTKITNLVLQEAEQYIGTSMTYSLIEYLKGVYEELLSTQEIENKPSEVQSTSNSMNLDEEKCPILKDKIEKKEQLTKAQKRRQWERLDGKGERPRGWNWIDIIKHLSQTGPQVETPTTNPI